MDAPYKFLWMNELSQGNIIKLDANPTLDDLMLLNVPTRSIVSLEGDFITSVQGLGQRTDRHVTLLGRMSKPTDKALLTLSDGSRYTVDFDTSKIPSAKLLSTQWANQRVTTLSDRTEYIPELYNELTEISDRFNILTPFTPLIALETLSEYLNYRIEPHSTSQFYEAWKDQYHTTQTQETTTDSATWIADISTIWQERINWWQNPGTPAPSKPTGHQPKTNKAPNQNESETVNPEPMKKPAVIKHEMGSYYRGFVDPPSHAKLDEPVGYASMPYIKALEEASMNDAYAEYLRQRDEYGFNPSFYLDCAAFFMQHDQRDLAIRILSNLLEHAYNNIQSLRTYAWRLREAEEYEMALTIMNRIVTQDPDDILTWRDLALTHTRLAKKNHSLKDAHKALELYLKVIMTPRREEDDKQVAVLAIEEFNALAQWVKREFPKESAFQIPNICNDFRKNIDMDLRIVLSWDSNQAIDMHVHEPSKEDVNHASDRSKSGAMLSRAVHNGYGTEEYLHRTAPKGIYEACAKNASIKQSDLTGSATVTATYFTNWGRPEEKSKTVTVFLDKDSDCISIGNVEVK